MSSFKVIIALCLMLSYSEGLAFAQECNDYFNDEKSSLIANDCGFSYSKPFHFHSYESDPSLPNPDGLTYFMTTHPDEVNCLNSDPINAEPGSEFELTYYTRKLNHSTQNCFFDIYGSHPSGVVIPIIENDDWRTIVLPEPGNPIKHSGKVTIILQCSSIREGNFIAISKIVARKIKMEDCPAAIRIANGIEVLNATPRWLTGVIILIVFVIFIIFITRCTSIFKSKPPTPGKTKTIKEQC